MPTEQRRPRLGSSPGTFHKVEDFDSSALVKSLYFVFCTKYLNITLRSKRGLCYNLSRRWGWEDDRMSGWRIRRGSSSPPPSPAPWRGGTRRGCRLGLLKRMITMKRCKYVRYIYSTSCTIVDCIRSNTKCDKCVFWIFVRFKTRMDYDIFSLQKVTRLWG